MAASVHLLPAVFLFSVFPAVVWSRGDVLELGDADWDYLAPEHQTMLVKFYAPGYQNRNRSLIRPTIIQ